MCKAGNVPGRHLAGNGPSRPLMNSRRHNGGSVLLAGLFQGGEAGTSELRLSSIKVAACGGSRRSALWLARRPGFYCRHVFGGDSRVHLETESVQPFRIRFTLEAGFFEDLKILCRVTREQERNRE